MGEEFLVAGFRCLDLRDLVAAFRCGEPAEEGVAVLRHVGRENSQCTFFISRRVAAVDDAAVREIEDVPRLDRGLACGADNVRAVTDADALCDGRAVRENKGIVVGGKACCLDVAADRCVFNVLGGGDVAVNKDTGFLAGIVLDHDGLDEAVGVLDLRCSAFHRHKAAEEALVFELCSGDGLRRGRLALTDPGDACHSDLALALIGGGGAGNADLVADLELACNREGIDAGGFILQVDAVKECSVLVIAGGVGGHDALDGELDALVRLFLNGLDRGDLGRIEHCQQIFADAVVGVVLLCGVIDLCLNLKVRHEGRAGDDDLTLARELLGRHDHQAVVALCIGVLRNAGAAAAVVVNVHGVGRCVAVDHGADRCGHCGGRLAVFIDRVDGRAAVVAEAFGVELVERMLRVKDHALQQRVVHVVGREVESPLVNAVGCGANIVIGRVVGDAEARTERHQNVVLRLRHVLDGRVFLDNGIVLVIVGPAGEDHRAAPFVEGLDGGELCLGVGLGVLLRCLKAAGGCGQNECLVLRVAAGRDQLLAGVELHRAHGILRGEVSEVAHGILVVARNVLVVMRGVDADVDELARVENIERDVLGEGVILVLERQDCRDGDRHHAGRRRRVPEGDSRRAGGRNRRCAVLGAFKLLAVYGVGDGLDGSVGVLTVKERRGDGQLLVGDRRCRAADCGGDAELERFADPDGCGHGDVAVTLGDADEVVAVLGSQLHANSAVCQLRSAVPLIGDLAGVDDQLDLLDGIGGVGIVEGDVKGQLLGDLGDDGAERHAVDGVADLEVLVLGGVDAHVAHGLIDALLREIIGQDDVTGVVGVAPAALVVILVVGRSEVPALVQRLDVLAVARVVAARADLAFAVADLDQIHTGVDDGIPVGKVLEGAEGRARMVELADGACALGLRQKRIVGLHARVVGLAVEGLVIAGDDAGGVEGIDVAGAAGPRHLKARDGDHAAGLFRVERFDRVLVGGPSVLAVGRSLAHVVECFLGVDLAGLVKVVGVVGERDKVNVRARRQTGNILQRAFQRARAVGILRVGVELAEVEAALGLTDGEAPSLFRRLFVGACDRHGHGDLAVCHVGSRGVGDLAALIDCVDLFAVDGHGHVGVLAGVRDLGGDLRALIVLRLGALCGGDVRDDRLVLDGDLDRAGEGRVFRILGADSHIERLAGDLLAGDDDGVGAVRKRRDIFFTVHGDLRRTLHAERRVDREGQRIFCALKGVQRRAEHDLRVVDNALVELHTLRHGIEKEGVDGVVRDFVHAVGLEGIGVVFQPLAVAAVKLRRAMLHLIAAHAAGAGAHEPVGVLSLDGIIKCLAVEGVVAGAVGAQVAVSLVLEAQILAVLLDLKHDRAVCRDSLAVCDLRRSLVDRRAFRADLLGQNRLGVLVVDHDLVASLGQLAGGGGGKARNIIRAAAVAELIISVKCRAAGIQRNHICFLRVCGERNALEQVLGTGFICDGRIAVLVVCTKRDVLDKNIFTQIFLAHLRDGDLLCRNRLEPSLHHGHGGELHLRDTTVELYLARNLDHIADYILCVIGVVIDLEAIDFAVDHVLKDDGVDAGVPIVVLAIVVHDLTDNGHVLRRAREFAGLLDVPCTLRDHVLRDRVINVAVPSDFLRLGVAELELAAVDANRRRNVQLIADLVFPSVLNLVDYSLVELDDLSIRVLNLDVRLLERAVAVINLRDLHVVDGNVGADVCRRQSADGGFLCAQHHARTHLERAAIKLRKTVELRALAGTDDGIAKVDVLRRGSEAEADAAGRVLKIIILAVHQRYNALDGKGLARASRKRRTDGNRLRLLDLNSIGKRCGVAVFHVFLRGLDGEGDILSHSRRRTLGEVRAVRRVGDRCALRCAGEGDLRTLFYLARSRGSRRGRDLIGRSRRGIELVQRKAAGIALRCFRNRFIFISSELVAACLVAGQLYGILASSGKGKLAVSKAGSPLIAVILANTVFISARRRNRGSLCIRHDDAVIRDSQRPDARGRILDFVICDAGLNSCNPRILSVVILAHRITRVDHKHILAGRQPVRTCDLREGLRLALCQCHGRHDRKDHDHSQQKRE